MARASEIFPAVLPWLLVLAGIVGVGSFVLWWLKRSLRSDEPQRGGEGFTLGDLRRMHADGQLSDEEFERAKTAIIGRLRPARSGNTEEGQRENLDDSGNRPGGPS